MPPSAKARPSAARSSVGSPTGFSAVARIGRLRHPERAPDARGAERGSAADRLRERGRHVEVHQPHAGQQRAVAEHHHDQLRQLVAREVVGEVDGREREVGSPLLHRHDVGAGGGGLGGRELGRELVALLDRERLRPGTGVADVAGERVDGADGHRSSSAIAGPNGACSTPRSVTMPVMSEAGVTSNAGFQTSVSAAGCARAGADDLGGGALLDRDRGAVGRARVDRVPGRGDVERDARVLRRDRERERADLVRGVAVRRDPVRADDDRVDLRRTTSAAAAAESTSSVTGMPASCSSQTVSRAPCRRGRVSVARTVHGLPRLRLRVDDAERGAAAGRRERAGVAVRQEAGGAGELRAAELRRSRRCRRGPRRAGRGRRRAGPRRGRGRRARARPRRGG